MIDCFTYSVFDEFRFKTSAFNMDKSFNNFILTADKMLTVAISYLHHVSIICVYWCTLIMVWRKLKKSSFYKWILKSLKNDYNQFKTQTIFKTMIASLKHERYKMIEYKFYNFLQKSKLALLSELYIRHVRWSWSQKAGWEGIWKTSLTSERIPYKCSPYLQNKVDCVICLRV